MNVYHAGRAGKEKREEGRVKRERRSDGILFTLALAFVAASSIGLLMTSGGERIEYEDAVPVFAEVTEAPSRGVWDALEDSLRAAFGVGK